MLTSQRLEISKVIQAVPIIILFYEDYLYNNVQKQVEYANLTAFIFIYLYVLIPTATY